MTDEEVEVFLDDVFEANYQRLRRTVGGYALSADTLAAARSQAILYWRRLAELARSVTDTEVRLVLPEQQSPGGVPYTLEGIVDLVRAGGRTTMYDLKTFLSVEADIDPPDLEDQFDQLKLYAYIWTHLREQPLHEVALIGTRPPRSVQRAWTATGPGASVRLQRALAAWNPVIARPVDAEGVDEVIDCFGQVVDAIEAGRFAAPPVEQLEAPRQEGGQPFGDVACLDCDARFGCSSYRQFQLRRGVGRPIEAIMDVYFADFGDDETQGERLDFGLEE